MFSGAPLAAPMEGTRVADETSLSEAERLERRWFRLCLVAWLVLLPLSAWLGAQEGVRWDTLASPVNALAGAFGAVVLGAVLFKRWQARIDRQRAEDEKRAWLERNLSYALTAREALGKTLATLFTETYDLLGPVFGEKRVPDQFLRSDMTRTPSARPDITDLDTFKVALGALVGELRGLTWPVATASDQVNKFYRALVLAEGAAAARRRHELVGDPIPANTALYEPPTQEQVAKLEETIDGEQVLRIKERAHVVAALLPDLTGARGMEPRTLRETGVKLLVAAEALVDAVDVVERSGGRPTRNEVLYGVVSLLGAMSALHRSLWTLARDLVTEADRVGGITSLHVILQKMTSSVWLETGAWEAWRRAHGFPDEESPDASSGAAAGSQA
jgi:hypothetical protein